MSEGESELDESETICRECDRVFQIEDGCEPCDYCHGCVYNVLDAVEVENERLESRVEVLLCTETDLTAEVERLRAERDLFREAGHAAEQRVVELKAEVERLRDEVKQAKAYSLYRYHKPEEGQPGKDACSYSERVEAEVEQLKAQLADAEKRAEYAWKDGFGSAEAGLAENDAEELRAPLKALREAIEALAMEFRASANSDNGFAASVYFRCEAKLRALVKP
jgi:DNA repair exonuclease SbcCD ATPase subunit